MKLVDCAKLAAAAVGILREHVNSPEGKAALAALKALAPVVPEVQEGLSQAEHMAMQSGVQSARPAAPPQGNGMGIGMAPRPQVVAGAPTL